MANTTFTGNVRENGDGSRTSVAGSMHAVAQYYVADMSTAGTRDVTKSSTNLETVLLPKGAIVDKVTIECTNAGAAGTCDLGFVDVVTGVALANADGLLNGAATTNSPIGGGVAITVAMPNVAFAGGAVVATEGDALGIEISSVYQLKVQVVGKADGGAGSAQGYVYYHIADDGKESN